MIRAAHKWPSNAEMIADVAKLGYINGLVLDPTYGEGTFWKQWRPPGLICSDIKGDGIYIGVADFTALPWKAEFFDAVVYDPPYKMNGTPSEPDVRYGVDVPATAFERLQLCNAGGVECARVLRKGGHLLWKMMDQVCSGEVVWQTDIFTETCQILGLKKVDRFDLLHDPRPQPKGREQVHAARCYSTLLVFKKV